MNKEKEIEVLNGLLTKAYDAEQGYEEAAKDCEGDAHLVSFFTRQSTLRFTLGKELKSEIKLLGGEPDKGASATAKAHQVWIAVKSFVAGSNNEAVLEECERGEEAALSDYDEAIQCPDLSERTKTMLREHRARIAEALTHIRAKEIAS